MYLNLLFDKWKFIFYSKLAQLSRLHKLTFEMSLNKHFPNIYEIRNSYLREYIKSIKNEFYALSNLSLFIWSTLMQLCFQTFFYKKINLKKVIYYLIIIIFITLVLLVLIYVFIIKAYITNTHLLTDLLPIFMTMSNKLLNNIFTYLILVGL